MLAATDFSHNAAKAMSRAAILAAEHEAELILLHVLDPEITLLTKGPAGGSEMTSAKAAKAEAMLSELQATVDRDRTMNVRRALRVGSTFEELNKAAAGADLLVVGARGSHPLLHVEVGTTTDRLLRNATQPVLVVKTAPLTAYRRVLVLVDFSASSEAALIAALQLAPGATLYLLHTFEAPFEGKLRIAGVRQEEILQYRERERQQALELLNVLLSNVQADRDRVEFVIKPGDIRVQSRHAMEDMQPDLIAVGKQGQSLVQDILLGSVTRTIVAEANCDVLVIPKGAQTAAE
jgi:nucleotide-binding universal stress UspA family protein